MTAKTQKEIQKVQHNMDGTACVPKNAPKLETGTIESPYSDFDQTFSFTVYGPLDLKWSSQIQILHVHYLY